MGFSRQGYYIGLPFPPPGDLSDPEIKPESPVSSALKADSLLLSHQEWGEAPCLELFLCAEVVVSFFLNIVQSVKHLPSDFFPVTLYL